jgi:hypothetical protein
MKNEKSFGPRINRPCSTNFASSQLAARPPALREGSESAKKVAVKKLAVQINPSNALAALPPAVREGFAFSDPRSNPRGCAAVATNIGALRVSTFGNVIGKPLIKAVTPNG